MAEKSPNAFRTISEVSDVLDVPAHVLRFWESRFNQIKPIKRGGGRRYYRPTDVELIRGIRTLLYTDGLTIKGAQKVLREKGVRHVMELGSDAAITDIAAEKPNTEAPAEETIVDEPIDPTGEATTGTDDIANEELAPESEPGFGATFAYEATEIGFLDQTDATDDFKNSTDVAMDETPTPVDPDADLSDPEPATADASDNSSEKNTDLRDIVSKLERLRDSMRS